MPNKEAQPREMLAPLLAAVAVSLIAVVLKPHLIDQAAQAENIPTDARLPRRPDERTPVQRFKTIVSTVYDGFNTHRIMSLAAGVAFFSLLAIFPAIAALVSLYGLFANTSSISGDLEQLAGVLPTGVIDVVKDQLMHLSQQPRGTLGFALAISVAGSLWSANSGVKALIDALNAVRGESERRSFVKLNAISLAFTTAAILFVILAMIAVVIVPIVLNFLAFNQAMPALIATLRWPAILLPMVLGLALFYRYGPCYRWSGRHWLTWGSVFAAVVWLAASCLFSWYTAQFGSFNKTYGSLGAVIGFLTWIWISSIIILVGAELDSAIARTSNHSS
jgi:membrane protein